MVWEILYLDRGLSRSIRKALSKCGRVSFAQDTSDALFMMADCDFDYYFIDADMPQARTFIQHLRHDPQLAPQRGVVLLTDNDDEDCEAWCVDTFVTRSRASEDVPYVFSHLRGAPSESASVLRIAPDSASEDADFRRPDVISRLREMSDLRPGTASNLEEDGDQLREGTGDGPILPVDVADLRDPKAVRPSVDGMRTPKMKAAFKLVAVVMLLASLALWLLVWGPLSSAARRGTEKKKEKTVEAESTQRSSQPTGDSETGKVDKETGPVNPYTLIQTQPSTPATAAEQTIPSPLAPGATVSPTEPDTRTGVEGGPVSTTPSPAAVEPAATAANHAPVASISGPGEVFHGQTVEFSASATDPDGDPVSLSWVTRTTCWSTPGQFSISVTATDSRGSSSTASHTVRVI